MGATDGLVENQKFYSGLYASGMICAELGPEQSELYDDVEQELP
jgi:hypothetical protein